MTILLQATFPCVKGFQDYHDIDDCADTLKWVFGRKIGRAEVGFSGEYWGVFYVGRKPSKFVIKELLDKAGFEPFEDW